MPSQLVLNVQNRLPVGGEFQGKNGDCVEYGFMICQGSRDPGKPTTGAELNRLTTEAIDDGEASASGAMTNANLAWLCSKEKASYQQTTAGDLIALTAKTAGYKPVCMGFSNGQALPGNEQGVHGHAIAILDFDGTNFTAANGDSTNGRNGKVDKISPSQMATAHPTQITILEDFMITPYDGHFTKESSTRWHVTDRPALVLQAGMLSYWQSIGGVPGLPTANENYSLQVSHPGHHISYQLFERAIQVYDPDHVIDNPPGSGAVYLAHISDARFQ